MSFSDQNLIWIDLEMTGLDPETHKIIEIATIVTDSELNILAEGPVLAIHQPEEELAKMDEWCTTTHTGSGLVARVKQSTVTEQQAIDQTIEFLKNGYLQVSRQSAATVLGRIAVFFMSSCQSLKHTSTTDISMSVPLKN